MDHDAFFLWLYEIQGRPGGDGEPLPPNLSWEPDTDATWPYFMVACYFDTKEGTVIARHHEDAKCVTVTFRCPAPGLNLIRTVRQMLGESGEEPHMMMEEAA
jgi:hypothetical protein